MLCGNDGRPGIDPEVAVRLMHAGLLTGIVHDRKLMREAHVNIAIRWFAGDKRLHSGDLSAPPWHIDAVAGASTATTRTIEEGWQPSNLVELELAKHNEAGRKKPLCLRNQDR